MSEIRLGLIGKNISHSKSQKMYEELLNKKIIYDLIDVDVDGSLPTLDFLKEIYRGISITSPYKKNYLNQIILSDVAKITGAINCLTFSNNKVLGTNTDYFAIKDFFIKDFVYEKFHCIILGDGVMAKTTMLILDEIGFTYRQYARKIDGDISQLNLSEIKSNSKILVINTCSRDYVFNGKLPSGAWFWDYNYNYLPHQTLLPLQCEFYLDGLAMLKSQATYALKFWDL